MSEETREDRLGGSLTEEPLEQAQIAELEARTKLLTTITAMTEAIGMIFLQKLKDHK